MRAEVSTKTNAHLGEINIPGLGYVAFSINDRSDRKRKRRRRRESQIESHIPIEADTTPGIRDESTAEKRAQASPVVSEEATDDNISTYSHLTHPYVVIGLFSPITGVPRERLIKIKNPAHLFRNISFGVMNLEATILSFP
jgi:hypothetical protein